MSVGSDHASWTAIGVPASFPFGASPSLRRPSQRSLANAFVCALRAPFRPTEADFDEINPAIHTANDDISRVDFTHVNEWVKLGLAYLVETSYAA